METVPIDPSGKPKLVCLLKKSLEGLKQSGNTWQVNNVALLTGACGMKQSDVEPTLFTRFFTIGGATVMLLLLVWVDDIWAAFTKRGREKILIHTFVKASARSPSNPNGYPIKLLGPVKKFVGLDVKHNIATNTLTLSNESYLKSMVPKFVTETALKT